MVEHVHVGKGSLEEGYQKPFPHGEQRSSHTSRDGESSVVR